MSWEEEKEELGRKLIGSLYEAGAIKTWFRDRPSGWILTSGLWSPFYIQLRPICSYENSVTLLREIGQYLWRLIQEEASEVNKLLGVAFAGIPIAVATTMVSGIPSCYTRKVKGFDDLDGFKRRIGRHGEHALVEGELKDGDVIAIVDDVVTKFDSKLRAISKLEYEIKRRSLNVNIKCSDVIVLVDREQGASGMADQSGVHLHCLIPFKSKGIRWLKDQMNPREYEVIRNYMQEPDDFQSRKVQSRLAKATRKCGETKGET